MPDALKLVVTAAGRAALINSAHDGTNAVRIAQAGLSPTYIAATPATVALPGEVKRVDTISGAVVENDTIHLIVRDESTDSYTTRSLALYLADGTLFAIYSQVGVLVEKSSQAMLLLQCDTRFEDIAAAQITFGNANFLNPPATTQTAGVAQIATDAEAIAFANVLKMLTPRQLSLAMSAATILSRLMTVDGAGSGLDADLLDGQQGAYYTNITARLGYTPLNSVTFTGSEILSRLVTVDGSGSGLDADLLDGRQANEFALLTGASFTGGVSLLNGATLSTLGAGGGAELAWLGATARLIAYDRTGAAYKPLQLAGSSVTLSVAGTDIVVASAAGATVTGNVWASGSFSVGSKLALLSDGPFITGGNISAGANSLALGSTGAGAIYFFTNNNQKAILTAAGNLGVGTANPDYKIVASNGGAEGIELGPGLAGQNQIQHYNRATNSYIPAAYIASQHSFYIAGAQVAQITAGGLGITGSTYSTSFLVGGAGVGGASISQGNAGAAGYLEFRNAANAQIAYIGAMGFNSALAFSCTAGFAFNAALTRSGNLVWDAGNDGSGSTLDADMVDGRHASEFALLTGAGFSGPVQAATPNSGTSGGFRLLANPTSGYAYLQVTDATAANQWGYFRVNATGQILWSGTISRNGNQVWDAGNDGAGSTMDADLLDGQEGSYYANITARLGYTPLNSVSYTAADILSKLMTVDGSGSLLDADLLDGKQATDFALMTDATRFGSNANGYWEKRPNGVIEQWGTLDANYSEGQIVITFPVAFTDVASINIGANPVNSAASDKYDISIQRVSKTVNGCVVFAQYSAAASSINQINGIDWRAIGR